MNLRNIYKSKKYIQKIVKMNVQGGRIEEGSLKLFWKKLML